MFEITRCHYRVVDNGAFREGHYEGHEKMPYSMGNEYGDVTIFEATDGWFHEQAKLDARVEILFGLNKKERDIEWLHDCLSSATGLLDRFAGDLFFEVLGVPILYRKGSSLVLNGWYEDALARDALYDELAQKFADDLQSALSTAGLMHGTADFWRRPNERGN